MGYERRDNEAAPMSARKIAQREVRHMRWWLGAAVLIGGLLGLAPWWDSALAIRWEIGMEASCGPVDDSPFQCWTGARDCPRPCTGEEGWP